MTHCIGVISPVLATVNISLLYGSEESRHLSCFLKPFLYWFLATSLLIIGLFSLLYKFVTFITIIIVIKYLFKNMTSGLTRDVMVSNAHRSLDPEDVKIFNIVYFVGVTGFIIVVNSFPVVQHFLHGISYISFCRNLALHPTTIMVLIPISLCLLALVFTIMISLKTRKSISKLQDQHSINLPSRNALSYLDTQLLCFSILSYLIVTLLWIHSLFSFSFSLFVSHFLNICFYNIIISIIFPVYIILKTRRYLPRLWDDESPIILSNNDFFAVRLSQVSSESIESTC